jgi:hypothetical protein
LQFLYARETQNLLSESEDKVWSLKQASFLNMRYLVLAEKGTFTPMGKEVGMLHAASFQFTKPTTTKMRFMQDVPMNFQIQDISRADSLAKVLALWQGNLVFDSSHRTRSTSTSRYRVRTWNYWTIICAAVAYGLWWHKPQSVQFPMELPLRNGIKTETFSES